MPCRTKGQGLNDVMKENPLNIKTLWQRSTLVRYAPNIQGKDQLLYNVVQIYKAKANSCTMCSKYTRRRPTLLRCAPNIQGKNQPLVQYTSNIHHTMRRLFVAKCAPKTNQPLYNWIQINKAKTRYTIYNEILTCIVHMK